MSFKELTIINKEASKEAIDSAYIKDREMYIRGKEAAAQELSREEVVQSISDVRAKAMFNMGYSYGDR